MPAPGRRESQRNRAQGGGGQKTRPQPPGNKGGGGKNQQSAKVPASKNWLASDDIYLQAKQDIGSAWTQFKNQQDVALGRAKTDLGSTLRDMRHQKSLDINDINADFAARGMGNSGELWNQRENVYKGDWTKQRDYAKQAFERVAGQHRNKKGKLVFDASSDLGMQFASQKLLKEQQKKNAYYEALLRKFQTLGLTGTPGISGQGQ